MWSEALRSLVGRAVNGTAGIVRKVVFRYKFSEGKTLYNLYRPRGAYFCRRKAVQRAMELQNYNGSGINAKNANMAFLP